MARIFGLCSRIFGLRRSSKGLGQSTQTEDPAALAKDSAIMVASIAYIYYPQSINKVKLMEQEVSFHLLKNLICL